MKTRTWIILLIFAFMLINAGFWLAAYGDNMVKIDEAWQGKAMDASGEILALTGTILLVICGARLAKSHEN